MDMQIPSVNEVREQLAALSFSELHALAKAASVPFGTMQKIQRGETLNPRLDTVRAFWPQLNSFKRQASHAGAPAEDVKSGEVDHAT